jgi:hypothetical protein
LIAVLQNNATPELCSHSALVAPDFAFGGRRLDTHLIEGSPEGPQVSLNMLLASLGIERHHVINVEPNVVRTAEAAGQKQDLRSTPGDFNMKAWRC